MVFTPDNTIVDVLDVNILVGTSGSDQILGLGGDDLIFGAEADDQLFGNEGADSVYGHQENDIIYGGSGADFLFGGQGDDSIFGDDGNDTIYADRGTDILIGGEGEDIFVLNIGSGNFSVTTTNLIVDFNADEDQIQLRDSLTFEDLSIEGTLAGDTVIRDSNSGEILTLLQGVNRDSVTEDRFVQETEDPIVEEPTITASLANDTGLDDRDNITTDPTITGTVTNGDRVAELEASLGEEFVSVETDIDEDGSFTLTQEQLEEALDVSFTDGIYTIQLRTVDTEGLRLAPPVTLPRQSLETAELTFTIAPDDDPPEQDIEFFPPGTDFLEPTITAELANDTGTSDSDGITSDPTITGTATDNFGIEEIEVSIGEGFAPVTANIAADGSFTLTQNQLEEALNTSFVDDTYTVFLRSVDTSGLRSVELAEVSFTLESPPTDSGGDSDDPDGDNDQPDQPINEEISIPESVEDTPTNVVGGDEDFPDPFEVETVEVPEDPGNTVAEAFEISVNSQTFVYSEQVSADDPVDYYVFNVENNQSFDLFLEGLSHDVDVYLLNINQEIIAASENIGITAESITVPLSVGTYYIQVESFDNQTTTYDLNILFPSRSPEVETTVDSLVRYDFVYYSNGVNTESDYYTGYVYAEEGTYEVGERYDFSSSSDGAYYIASEGSAPATASVDQVFINNYYDVDININSAVSYNSYYSSINQASGFSGLGSEYDFVEFEGIFFGFGLRFVTTNIVLPFFDNFNFPQRDDYFVGDRPTGITSADLDSDGDNDLIVGNPGIVIPRDGSYDGNRVSILTNNGDGTFAAPRSITTGVGPTFIAEDFDGDGNIDLATAHAEDDDLSVFLNDGDGNFAAPETYEAGDRPFMANVGDLDNDGDLDLVTINSEALNLNTANNEGDSISIHYNDGDGGFTERETLTVGQGVVGVEIADLDEDGNLDLITSNQAENTISVLFNTGDAFLTTPEKYDVGERPVSPVAADLDNDGDLDLGVPNFGSSSILGDISILRNDGNGNFSPSEFFFSEDDPSNLTPTDIDGDGDLDLMMQNSVFIVGTAERSGNTVSVLRNNGDGFFSFPESFLVGNVPVGLVVDDLDGEGNLDFATANFDDDDVTVYLQS